MRSPRSRPRCRFTFTCKERSNPCDAVTCNSTGPQRASRAACTAFSTSCMCKRAAPAAPRRGARRVFTRPATGARAKTITRASARIGVIAREALWLDAERIEEPQAPHEEDRSHDTARLPAPPGSRYALGQARRRTHSLHGAAESDVLHEGNLGKPDEYVASDEDRLVARGDAAQPRAEVHPAGDEPEQRMAALDAHIEAAPGIHLQRVDD